MATQAQITAYKKAHKNQNMSGMLQAAGGKMANLSGIHKAAYPKAKAAAPRPTTRGVTTKKTGTMAGRGQMATVGRTAASPRPATRIAGSVAQAPKTTTRGTTTTGGPRATASYRGPRIQGRGRLATVGIKGASKATGSLKGKSLVKQITGAHRKASEAFKSAGTGSLKGKSAGAQIIGGLSKAQQKYQSAIQRSGKATVSGIKKLKPKKSISGFNRRQGSNK